MRLDECYQLGYAVKKHGLNGEVVIFLDVDFPEQYLDLESVFVEINDKLVPFFIEHISIKEDKAIVKFEDVNDVASAEELKSKRIFLPLSNLPPLEEGQFYYHEIIGHNVTDQNKGALGKVVDVYTSHKQDLLVVDYHSKEVLIPLNDDILISVDHENAQVLVQLPDGLLEVYLDN